MLAVALGRRAQILTERLGLQATGDSYRYVLPQPSGWKRASKTSIAYDTAVMLPQARKLVWWNVTLLLVVGLIFCFGCSKKSADQEYFVLGYENGSNANVRTCEVIFENPKSRIMSVVQGDNARCDVTMGEVFVKEGNDMVSKSGGPKSLVYRITSEELKEAK